MCIHTLNHICNKSKGTSSAFSDPFLFNIFNANQPTHPNTTVSEFPDNKAILFVQYDPEIASYYLQYHLGSLQTWYVS